MTLYNVTAIDQANNTYQFVERLNLITTPEGALILVSFYTMGFVAFLACRFAGADFNQCLFVTTAGMTFIGSLLVFANVMSWSTLGLPLAGLVGSMLLFMFNTR